MATDLYILGAGASFECGAPLMRGFLDTAEDLLEKGQLRTHAKSVKKVLDLTVELQGINSKSYVDLDNIESLFGLLEMAQLVGSLGDHTSAEIDELKDALIDLIVVTLEESIRYRVNDKRDLVAAGSYDLFVRLVERSSDPVVITLNYDLALDHALASRGHAIDYCLQPQNRRPEAVRLLKLHGSLNWGYCTECRNVIPYQMRDYLSKYPISPFDTAPSKILTITERLGDLAAKHPHASFEPRPFIVPPTWTKTAYTSSLANVWHVAISEMKAARNIYVLGYSMPETDVFFRYLFALGVYGRSRIRRFWVFNPDVDVESRFRKMLGQGIRDRFGFRALKFKDAIATLEVGDIDK